MMKLPLVYVAGPITKPCPLTNCKRGLEVGERLRVSGVCIPFIPHLSCFYQIYHPLTHSEWLAYDKQIVLRCDALYRIRGTSVGADEEWKFAVANGIPVFLENPDDSDYEFWEWCRKWIGQKNAKDLGQQR